MQKFLGILIVIFSVFGGYSLAQGNMLALWQPAELIIILGAGIGALVLANPIAVLKLMWQQTQQVFQGQQITQEHYQEMFALIYMMFEQVRQSGIKSLDEHLDSPFESSMFLAHPKLLECPQAITFLTDNLRLLSMGKILPHELEQMLEQEIENLTEDQLRPAAALQRSAEAMPGFGILGAVVGIIITMQSIDGPLTMIGVHVAAALVGTFIGIFACYCILDPLASALEHKVKDETVMLESIRAALSAYHQGKATMICIDAARKQIRTEIKPSFVQVEHWIEEATH
ncbi:flagellar motor stator protein MotA [Paraferrimonas sp. SM1919]|uniref:flagellar motor stator protein MotA n=1 Tax=Paraferrimonas sp. SM1919 TaxID=2662263 RepID=UPI0013D4EC8E|nr:flagellar motor stator protein MotA [Paraferrimonas sp. SM1919]